MLAENFLNEIDVSVIAPVFHNRETLRELHERIETTCRRAGFRYELIFVDDASPDGSWELIKSLADRTKTVRGVRLRCNMGQHFAVLCGFSLAHGKLLISLDADIQDLPEHIPHLIQAMTVDTDVVFGGRSGVYQGRGRMFTSWLYRCTLPLLTRLPRDAGMFLVIRRAAAGKLLEVATETPSLLAMIGVAKMKAVSIPVHRRYRSEGRSAYGSLKRFCAYSRLIWCVLDLKIKSPANRFPRLFGEAICETTS